jgi:hypothetical protein
MNLRRSFILALVLTGSGLAYAATADNPYTPIVTRNIFGLVPIPVVDPASLVPEIPPPKITPNGIMTLFGKLQVLFKVAVAAPGQPPKDESYVMGEGERENDIEVQKIDEKSATITFNNHGTVQELALVVSKGPTGAPAPAGPGLAPAPIPRPGVAPLLGGGPAAAIGFGGRFGRNRPAPGAGTPGGGGAPGFGGGGAATAGTANSTEPLSPEAQVIMMEAQREEFKAAGNPAAAIIPPTPITDQLNGDGGGGAGGPPVPGQ